MPADKTLGILVERSEPGSRSLDKGAEPGLGLNETVTMTDIFLKKSLNEGTELRKLLNKH